MKKICILLAAALIFVWQISYFQRESDRRFEGVFGGEIRMMEKPKVALTFDDGPHPYLTDRLLDGLKERGVKVTFFMLGKNIEGNQNTVKRVAEEGV